MVDKEDEGKREPGVTSMANARSRGNIPLTDVDKHCDRERSPTPWAVRLAIERNPARNGEERGPGNMAYCFFQVSSQCWPYGTWYLFPRPLEIRNDGYTRGERKGEVETFLACSSCLYLASFLFFSLSTRWSYAIVLRT